MSRKTPKPVPVTDPTAHALLDRVRHCDIAAVGALADRLDETGHPLATRVRAAWESYLGELAHWQRRDLTRTRWTKWQRMAHAARNLRRAMSVLFGGRWPPVKIIQFTRWAKP